MNNNKLTNQLTEHLFRNFYQEVFSSLVIKFGTKNIDLIEDALQETFYKALKSWKFNDYPKKPKDWLFVVTRNNIINELRKLSKLVNRDHIFISGTLKIDVESSRDDQLKLLLACSKFDIKPRAKLVFTLKAICGFGITEIANSLLLTEDNIYRIGQRTKQKLKSLSKDYFISSESKKVTLNDANYIEQIIYFMFNEGYDSINKSSKTAINKEICFEAVRLAHLLEEYQSTESIKNLLALCYFHMARFDSRTNEKDNFVSLRHQDRTKWDDGLIQLGFKYLTKPKELNRYYLEALIASFHSRAPSFKETNWQEILKLYDALLQLNDSPVVRLNRAICMFELKIDDEAVKELEFIKDSLKDSYLYYSVSMAEYLKDKNKELSEFWYQKSLDNTKQPFRKEIINSKLGKLYIND